MTKYPTVLLVLAVLTTGCVGRIPTLNDWSRAVIYGSDNVSSVQDGNMEMVCRAQGGWWMVGLGQFGCLTPYQGAGILGWGRQENGQVRIYADENRNLCPNPVFMGVFGAAVTSVVTGTVKGAVIGGVAAGGGCAAINAVARNRSSSRGPQKVPQQIQLPDGKQAVLVNGQYVHYLPAVGTPVLNSPPAEPGRDDSRNR